MSRWGDIFALSHTISLGARVEALRWGHPQIDVEHVLLALIAGDGPAGRMLREYGITLDDARTAVEVTHDGIVADLGIATSGWIPREATDPLASELDWSPGALRLLEHPGDGSSDLAILEALLDESSGFIVDTLSRLRVDADDLRTRLADARRSVPGPTLSHDDPNWRRVSCSAFAPTAAARVWDLVSDPRRRPEWDALTVSVVQIDQHTWHLQAARVRADGRPARVSRRVRHCRLHLVDIVPGVSLEWETTWPLLRRPVVHRLRICLNPVEGGTRIELHLRMARRRGWRGVLQAVPAALRRFMARQLLITQAAGIVRAVR
jgi:hypothetical protein